MDTNDWCISADDGIAYTSIKLNTSFTEERLVYRDKLIGSGLIRFYTLSISRISAAQDLFKLLKMRNFA